MISKFDMHDFNARVKNLRFRLIESFRLRRSIASDPPPYRYYTVPLLVA
jgi:hypothetical protein